MSKPWTVIKKRKLVVDAIRRLHERGEYPSVMKICSEIGRVDTYLHPYEAEARNEVFTELGIDLHGRLTKPLETNETTAALGSRNDGTRLEEG